MLHTVHLCIHIVLNRAVELCTLYFKGDLRFSRVILTVCDFSLMC